jgi:hypothetical protein
MRAKAEAPLNENKVDNPRLVKPVLIFLIFRLL